MKWNDLYVAGLGTYLPGPLLVEDAVQAGELTAERRDSLSGYESVLVSDGLAGPEMAALAARDAVAQAGIDIGDYGIVLNSCAWFEGRSMWAAASYVANQAVSVSVPAFDVRQRCNGGMATIELGANHLAGNSRGTAALLANGDRFSAPAVDRWTTHGKAFYGDGGTAMVLSSRPGFARVLSSVTLCDNLFEGMARGTVPLDECPPSPEIPLSLADRYAEFMADKEPYENYTRVFGVIQDCRDAVLAEAGVKLGDVARVVDAATHGGMSDELFTQLYGFSTEQTTWDYGRTTGHLGAGDQFAGLAHLLRTEQVGPGDLVLLFGGGAGFTCTAALVEILDRPAW